MSWLLVVGGQEQGSGMMEAARMVCNALVAGGQRSGAGQRDDGSCAYGV